MQCANASYRCFGFRVNKCMREDLSGCMATIGDAQLCAAWDAACAAREQYFDCFYIGFDHWHTTVSPENVEMSHYI